MLLSNYSRKILLSLLVVTLVGLVWIKSRQLPDQPDWVNGTLSSLEQPSSLMARKTIDPNAAANNAQPPTEATMSPPGQSRVAPVTYALPLSPEQRLLRTILAPGKLMDMLQRAQSEGGVNSTLLAEFLYIAKDSCGERLRAAELDKASASEEVRRWAIQGLIDACEGFDAKLFTFNGEPDETPGKTFDNFGKEAGADAAMRVVAEATDLFSLGEAGRVLVLADALPASLQSSTRDLGSIEKMKSWMLAVKLHQCNLAGGCGPQSLNTLTWCAQVGCRPNSDYRAALQQTLPPGQYTAMLAYLNWIETLKRSG